MCCLRTAVYVVVANHVIYDGWSVIASAVTSVLEKIYK
jgi:hypothetical protein